MITTTLKEAVKKTGYPDIDKILMETHEHLIKSSQLQKEIEKALKFKPVIPNSIKNLRGFRYKRFLAK